MLSRVADNLYWMSRYLERAEHTGRLISVALEAMVEQSKDDAEASWRRVVGALHGEGFAPDGSDLLGLTHAIAFDRLNPSSMIVSLRGARDNARQVREQISSEMWRHLNQLYLGMVALNMRTSWNDQPAVVFRDAVEDLHTFEGISYSTMRHGEGWHFIQLGRYMERAQLVSHLLNVHFGAGTQVHPTARYLDWIALLKSCTAFEAYCKVYTANIRPERIAEFLLFDAEFPHSVRFSVERLRDALARVAPGAPSARRAGCDRLAGRLKASVDFGQIDELMGGGIDEFLSGITTQCEQIHEAIYSAYITYGAETVV